LGIPKITIARFETLEGDLKAEQLMKLLDLYGSMGAKLELSEGDGFSLTVEGRAEGFSKSSFWILI
jgi:hypothetical protein